MRDSTTRWRAQARRWNRDFGLLPMLAGASLLLGAQAVLLLMVGWPLA